MRRSANVLRAFVAAVALLLSALLAVDSAAAQVTPVAGQSAGSAQQTSISAAEEHEEKTDNCQARRTPRNPVNIPAPAASPLQTCVCHTDPPAGPTHVAPVTGSEAFSMGRTVELPVLHQVFRC